MLGRVAPGSVVRVRMHGRNVRAYVTELLAEPAVPSPTPLSSLLSDEPLFGPEAIELGRWAGRRYIAPLGLVLHHAVPGRYSAPSTPGSGAPPVPRTDPPAWLRDDRAPDAVVRGSEGAVLLLPDVERQEETVRHLVGEAAAAGRRSLVVAPRIAVARRIGGAIEGSAIIHSDLRPARRAEAWARARDGDATVVVGGRGALFAPIPDLGLVVVASAHDRTLKEERTPRIHGLWAGRERARIAGAAFAACSPVPPLELIVPAAGLRILEGRREARPDLRPEVVGLPTGPVTPRLLDAVRGAVARGEDALVFVVRRGAALRIRCRDCGWYPRCDTCGTGLTEFRDAQGLRCRTCGRVHAAPERCPACGNARLDGAGWGDERLAEALRDADVGAPTLRVDADSPMPRDRPRPAVIVGTQTALWSLEPGSAGAVCVADLDQALGLPDFRAGEHALALLHELAGALAPGGRFVCQTREPEHHVVQAFTRRSFPYFAERELHRRSEAAYPPFGEIVHADFPPQDGAALREVVEGVGGGFIGPLPRPGGRATALIRCADVEPLLDPLRGLLEGHPNVRLDVDPVEVL